MHTLNNAGALNERRTKRCTVHRSVRSIEYSHASGALSLKAPHTRAIYSLDLTLYTRWLSYFRFHKKATTRCRRETLNNNNPIHIHILCWQKSPCVRAQLLYAHNILFGRLKNYVFHHFIHIVDLWAWTTIRTTTTENLYEDIHIRKRTSWLLCI